MKFIPSLSPLLIVTLFSLTAHAQNDVMVVKSGQTISIRVPVLTGNEGKNATAILTQDLTRSGWFTVTSSGGSYSVDGSASSTEVSLKVFTSDGKPALSPSASGSLRQSVHSVADQIIEKLTGGHKGICQTRIAFISNKSGKKELYSMDYDGYNVLRLTSDKSIVGSPNFSPNRSQIVYTSYRSGFPDVYLMDYASKTRSTIARFPALNSGASFSPDGQRIALTISRDGNPELYTMNSSGGSLKRLTRTRGGESSPCWSPDGKLIAYTSDEGGHPQIYVIPASGGSAQRLSRGGYNTEPEWSAEANLIAYCSLSGGNFAIRTMNPEGREDKTVYSNGSCEDPSWGRDGRHIVFSRTVNWKSNLYLLDTVTQEAIQLTKDFGDCTQPTWSQK